MEPESDEWPRIRDEAANYLRKLMPASEATLLKDARDYLYENYAIEDENAVKSAVEAAINPVRSQTSKPASREAIDDTLISSPFRFVDLNEEVVMAEAVVRTLAYDVPMAEGFSGEIEVALAFETPMLIGEHARTGHGKGDGNEDLAMPLKLSGDYVIPGSSLRGWLRTAMEIVCHARLSQLNKHHQYGVRDFDHPLFAKPGGESVLGWHDTKAGWLKKATEKDPPKQEGDSDYVITRCKKMLIRIRDLPHDLNKGSPTDNGNWHYRWLNTPLEKRYELAQYQDMERLEVFEFSQRTAQNFTAPRSVASGSDSIRPDPRGPELGWLVCANKLGAMSRDKSKITDELDRQDTATAPKHHKKHEYVFVDIPGEPSRRLKQALFDRFARINSKAAKNKLKPLGSWAVMKPTLDAGLRIPIFFIGDLDDQKTDFDFGLTRLFKRAHTYTVGEVHGRSPAHALELGRPDMVSALFGHVWEGDDYAECDRARMAPMDMHRKGRIAIGFFQLDRDCPATLTSRIKGVAAAPRASFAPFYLKGRYKDWSDKDARLAGRKLFFPRFTKEGLPTAQERIAKTICSREGSSDQSTCQHFLIPTQANGELVFTGPVRFHNVTAAEIGAVLWTLTHGGDPRKPCRHMIGRAKSAGAGQMRVKSLCLRFKSHLPLSAQSESPAQWELPASASAEGWLSPHSVSMAPFLRRFEEHMRATIANWPMVPGIREFLGCCTPRLGKNITTARKDRYPPLKAFRKIRQSVQAAPNKPAPHSQVPDRLLAAETMPESEMSFPYRTSQATATRRP